MEVQVASFCYINSAGGTGISKGSAYHVQYPHTTARVNINQGFFDYETGWRFIGVSADPELTAFLATYANKDDLRVFVSEFELADRRDLGPLIDCVDGMRFDSDSFNSESLSPRG